MGEADEVRNIFSDAESEEVDVTVIQDGKKITIGKAKLTSGAEGIVHVDMDLKTDEHADVVNLFKSGITGYSIAEPDGPAHRMTEAEIQKAVGVPPHNHNPKQHRDMKPPWCNECTLTADYRPPQKNFNFGTPALPLRRDA